jgi:3-oxoacyl-[acyl-carrier protein] reductase
MEHKRSALVTGAAKGIGKAIVTRLHEEGYYVIAVDVDDKAGKKLEEELGFKGIEYCHADISLERDVDALFVHIKKDLGHLDVLVNNAGIIRDNLIWNMKAEDFDAVININLRGTWLLCREAAKIMKQQKSGRIVNIASRAWLGNAGQSNYAASKAGIVGLTRVLALELGRHNVLVNAIAPGLIDTTLSQKLEPAVLQKLIDAQPTRSMGQPCDIAHAVSFLVSEQTQFITGQTLYVDGGKSIGAGI